jgi:glycosyltransferase involved in cell wall biosynthesis
MSSIDVIVPCYRYGHFLRECVESILTQSGPSVRVLIIDDASPDNTSEVATDLAKADSRVTFLRHSANRGHIATYNEGIEWASSDYLLILSADDYLLPGALERATNLMNAHPEVAFVFGNAIRLDPSGTEQPIRTVEGSADSRVLDGHRFIDICGVSNIVVTSTAVVRTKLAQKVGGYRPELPHSGDLEMWLRLAAHGSVGMVKTYQGVYRRHPSNMSLGYMADGCISEFKQRQAALDCFFQTCDHLLPNAKHLQRRLYRSLARTALGVAGQAVDEGHIETSQRLSSFALRLCPSVRRSLSWVKWTYKHRIRALSRRGVPSSHRT